ncbi:MAG: hypothetical protein C4B56_00630 [Candidatus Methanophagaceae archaeon]|nr:MAG: hypothetical protein C4B56_00630 [Methanophagales archaeon]
MVNDDMKRALSLFTIIIIIITTSVFPFLFLQTSPTLVSVTTGTGTGTGTGILRETWNRTFTAYRNYNDTSYAVQQTADGGYILVGVVQYSDKSSDALLVKTSSSGEQTWAKTFGGVSHDQAYAVQQTSDGGYILAGITFSPGNGLDAWLVKTDSNGNELWDRTFGHSDQDWAYAVQQTSDGGYILAGATLSYGAGSEDAWLVKTDSEGNELWNMTFGGVEYDEARAVQLTPDGGYILAGVTLSYGAGKKDAWLVKTDSEGNELWNMTFGGASSDAALAVQLTPDGGYILAGVTLSYGAGNEDAWLVKTDSKGNELWNMTFGGASNDEAWAVQPTPDDGYLFTGRTGSYGAGNADAWLFKTDSGGEELWNMTFGGTGYDDSRAIQQTADGGYILAGSTFSFSSDSSSDFWLIKLGITITNISFDTGSGYGTYPSISGIHKGVIIPRQDMHISKLYTYPCTGTGGHTESIALYEDDDSEPIATGIWKGYHSHSDWHNITLYDAATGTPGIRLLKGHQYRYVISTGSYPQIIHKREHKTLDGSTIKCIEFKDVNGKVYHDWIPAFRFYS